MSWSSSGSYSYKQRNYGRKNGWGNRSRNGKGRWRPKRRAGEPSKSEKFAFSTGVAYAKGATGQTIKFKSKDSVMRQAFKAGYNSVMKK